MTIRRRQPKTSGKPSSGSTPFRRGQDCWREGRLEEAVGHFRESAALEPGYRNVYFALGKLLHELRRYGEAIDAYRMALEVNPCLSMAYQQLGLILQFVGDTDAALAMWRQWTSVEPNHPIPRHMVAAATGQTLPRASDDYVRALFDEFAESFDEQLELLGYRAPELIAVAIARRLGRPTGQLEILDAGCGTGLCGPFLRPYARRLTGVDLSTGMLDRAWAKGGYDKLVRAELTGFIRRSAGAYDLIASADTFVYVGDLKPVCDAAGVALRSGGHLFFSLEKLAGTKGANGFRLQTHGRYAHTVPYVKSCLRAAGFGNITIAREVERTEMGRPVIGLVVAARKLIRKTHD